MGMGMSPQIWQQFVDLVFQNNLIKHKQNFDIRLGAPIPDHFQKLVF